jgi:hypothetical protein
MGTRSFLEGKRPELGVNHPPSYITEVKETVELSFYFPFVKSEHVIG